MAAIEDGIEQKTRYSIKYGKDNTLNIIVGDTYNIKSSFPNEDCASVYDIVNSKLVKKYYTFRNIFKRCHQKLDVPVVLYVEAKINGEIKPVPFARFNSITEGIIDNIIKGESLFDIPGRIRGGCIDLLDNSVTLFDMINIKNDKFPYVVSLSAGEHPHAPLNLPLLLGDFYLMRTKSSLCWHYPPFGFFKGAQMYCTDEVFGIVIKRDSTLFDILAIDHVYWLYDFKGVEEAMGGKFIDHRMTIGEVRQQFKEMIDV